MNVSIIGSGIVGTATGTGLVKLGHKVIFYDIDKERVQNMRHSNWNSTFRIDEALSQSNISFVTVPTPFDGKKMNLKYIKSAITSIAKCLAKKNTYHLIVVKSTVLPNTTQKVIIPLLEKVSGKKVGTQIGICVNPEFLTEINQTWTENSEFSRGFFSEDRIVIGEYDQQSGELLKELYTGLNIPIIRTNIITAEMIKLSCNCALANRISYWNEIFHICQILSIDSNLVASTAAMDKRIGKYGTIHGKAFGGKCLPKDLQALIRFSMQIGYDPHLLKAVLKVNDQTKKEHGVRE